MTAVEQARAQGSPHNSCTQRWEDRRVTADVARRSYFRADTSRAIPWTGRG